MLEKHLSGEVNGENEFQTRGHFDENSTGKTKGSSIFNFGS